jgi:hypothetical protein
VLVLEQHRVELVCEVCEVLLEGGGRFRVVVLAAVAEGTILFFEEGLAGFRFVPWVFDYGFLAELRLAVGERALVLEVTTSVELPVFAELRFLRDLYFIFEKLFLLLRGVDLPRWNF